MSEWVKGMQFGSHIIDERLEDGTYLTHCAECGRGHVHSRYALVRAKEKGSCCRSCHTAKVNQNRATHGLMRVKPKALKSVSVFRGILTRCYNPVDEHYPCYGGRGIQVDAPWVVDGKPDYAAFDAWYSFEESHAKAIYPEKDWGRLTVDRMNPNGNYSPDNCRLTTPRVQANNRRNTRHIGNVPMREWYDSHKKSDTVCYDTFARRVSIGGWNPVEAIQQPARGR